VAGTADGGKLTSIVNRQRYGEAYYIALGRLGGSISRTGGFYGNPEAAAKAGKIGGSRSKRTAKKASVKLSKAARRQLAARKLLRDLKANKIPYSEYMRLTQALYDY